MLRHTLFISALLLSANCTNLQAAATVTNGTVMPVVVGTKSLNFTTAGTYKLTGLVTAPNNGANSFWVDFDSDPVNMDYKCWDLNINTKSTSQPVTWRAANATTTTFQSGAQFNPKTWALTAGAHTLYIRLREVGSQISTMTFNVVTPSPTPTPTPAQSDIGKSWTNRKPIGRIVLSDLHNVTASNLNGWYNGGPNALGVAGFQNSIVSTVNNTIQNVQSIHGQGIIIWDISGVGCTNLSLGGSQYTGDPRILAPGPSGLTVKTSYGPYVPPTSNLGLNGIEPAMNAIADQLFASIRNAGLVPGVCLRAQPVIVTAGGDMDDHGTYATVNQQLADMDAKLVYSYNRWGCRMFYVDSSQPSTDVVSSLQGEGVASWAPAYLYTQLNIRHPDCLILPEQTYPNSFTYSGPPVINDLSFQFYRVTCPYTQLFNPYMDPFFWSGTLSVVSDAFTLIDVQNETPPDTADTPNIVAALQNNRCILLADAWYSTPGLTLIKNWQTTAGVNGF
jgi:hypothetical protein